MEWGPTVILRRKNFVSAMSHMGQYRRSALLDDRAALLSTAEVLDPAAASIGGRLVGHAWAHPPSSKDGRGGLRIILPPAPPPGLWQLTLPPRRWMGRVGVEMAYNG